MSNIKGKVQFLKRMLISAAFSFTAIYLPAQTGAPLLTNYKDTREIENQNWAICQDENNVMLFASRKGITTFDGRNRGFIPLPAIPSSLGYNSREKRVYVGCDNNYGYLFRDEKGIYKFKSLLPDSTKVGLISRIIFTDSTVYFYSEWSINRHDLKTGLPEMRLFQEEEKPFTGMFVTPVNTFINVKNEGLYRLESDTLFPIVTGYLLKEREILFSLPYDKKMVLLGFADGNLSLFDGIKFYIYPVRDDGYLKQNTLSDGIVISDSLYAFSTLDGGAIVVARRSGVVRKTINYLRGLPDDEVFALGTDYDNGLWLSHQYGLSRAELLLPVGNFTMYKGLMGNLISSVWHNNELYVATSEGIFYLAQVRSFAQEQVMVKKEPAAEIPVDIRPAEISTDQLKKPPEQQETQKSRKSVFSRIFGKKSASVGKSDEKTVVEKSPAAEVQYPVQAPVTQPAEPQFVRKTVNRLKSVNYEYRKAEGLNEKCKQLVSTGSGILASTNKGLFVINNHIAKPLVTGRYIYSISRASSDNRYYVATSDGYFYVTPEPGGWMAGYPDISFAQPVYSVVSAGDSTLWAGSDDEVIRITLGKNTTYRSYGMRSDFPLRYVTNFENDTLFIFSTAGVCYYDRGSDSIRKYLNGFKNEGGRLEYVISQPETPWIRQGDEWKNLGSRGKVADNDRAILKIFDNIVSIVTDDKNIWVITGDNQIYRVTKNTLKAIETDLSLFIRSIRNDKGQNFEFSDIVLSPGDNFVYFDIVAPGYIRENSIQYQWIVDKLMDDWTAWQSSSVIPAPLQHGTFTISVRAKDIWGNISEIKSITFTRKAPFTQTTLFYTIILFALFLIVILIVWFRERQLQREKHVLEEKVRERTAEIEAQKEEITSSIEYASRIQLAMLPGKEQFSRFFPEHFILYKPRDIVSGDFFWIGEDQNHIYLTVADCTGHGVPGAFMSTLGISTLNEIITNKKDLHSHTVLNLLRERIKTSMHQTGREGEATDGMDLSFCILHKDRKFLEYSGAFNPLLIAQNGEIKEYKADRMPIGIYVRAKETFTNYEINVSSGDALYLFSDGLTDQFGGPDGSKYKRSTLKKLLSEIHHKSMEEQKIIIDDVFEKWKGSGGQIDDVTIIGVRI